MQWVHSTDKWCEHSPQRLLKNTDCKIHWNLKIQTNKVIKISLFPSYLRYGNAVCCRTSMTKLKELLTKQSQAIEAIPFPSRLDYLDLKW